MPSERVRETVDGPEGFALGVRFTPEELQQVRALIREQWLERITKVAPESAPLFREIPMDEYHRFSDRLPHADLWGKAARILPMSAVDRIRRTTLFAQLEEAYGPFTITREEEVEQEELTWRLVRPGVNNDVGPLHADAWFWELRKCPFPDGFERVKVWIAIHCETGKTGLRVVPASHRREWPYSGEYRNGIMKPNIELDESTLDILAAPTQPGDAVVFHDRLLHGGIRNSGTRTRVSLEFTMVVPKRAT